MMKQPPYLLPDTQQDGGTSEAQVSRLLGRAKLDDPQFDQLQEALGRRTLVPMDQGGGYRQERFDLSTTGARFTVGGWGLYYRRRGSSPAGRLNVQIGGEVRQMSPGDRITGPFNGFSVEREASSGQLGFAELLVIVRPDATFAEMEPTSGLLVTPVDLLGASSVPTFVAVTEDTQPSGASPSGSFDATGWRVLRVILDGQAANTLTSCDLIPWVREPNSGLWLEQGTERIGVPDTNTSAYRYRVVYVPTNGADGKMYFEVANLLPAPATQVGMIVQGIA